jgi:GT2 family glycosyltransferase
MLRLTTHTVNSTTIHPTTHRGAFPYRSAHFAADKHKQRSRDLAGATEHLNTPTITFILASHNRRDILLRTLAHVTQTEREGYPIETFVVDNFSADGTVSAIQRQFPNVNIIAHPKNIGSCAKTLALNHATGQYTIFLDDDSHPRPGCLKRMIAHFKNDPSLAAAGFIVHLPDGTKECSAFPNVFIGCGVGLRTQALKKVGGLDQTFFMQAEEFDLSFRLVNEGWRVRTFDDLHVDHLKTPQSRLTARTTFYDTRNNLLLVDRYLNEPYRTIYAQDWRQRYGWIAAANQHRISYLHARTVAASQAHRQRAQYATRRLTPAALQTLFRFDDIEQKMQTLANLGRKTIAFADLGKNVYAFFRAAQRTNLTITCIADDRFQKPNRRYRNIPIIPVNDLPKHKVDAIVVANTAPVHAATTESNIQKTTTTPVHSWFSLSTTATNQFGSIPFAEPADTMPESAAFAQV